VVIIVSFTSGFSLRFPPPGYSLRWYGELLNAWQLHFAAGNSFKVAVWTTLLSVTLGVAAALAIARSQRWSARVLDSFFMSPLVLPALSLGLAALMFFSLIGLPVSPLTLVIGHTIVCVPYVLRTTVAALAQLNPTLLESSASLGATRFMTFRRVTLPLIRPGILAGAFIAFMASFDNVPISLFLRDANTDMLPIRMWQDLEGRLDVTIAALSGVLIVATLALMLVMERVADLSRRLR
jgi:putative spermidine/putrescine transport system permease protein